MTTEKALNRERWGKPSMTQDSSTPTPWEKYEMRPFIERHPVLQGKLELQLDDVKLLADVLARDGIEEAGRVLGGDAILPHPMTRTISLAASTGAAAGSAAAATRSSRAQLLHAATAEGNVAEIRRAVAKGTDANDKSDATRMTPLITAAAHGHLDAVKLLLELRGDPRLRSGDGNTALMVAALHGREEIAKLLHENEGVEGAPRKEVNIHELKNNASQASPPHPVENLMAGKTVPTQQVAEWLLSMSWPRADHDKMAVRVQKDQEEHKWSEFGRNLEALEKHVEGTRKKLGPILKDLEETKKATFGGVNAPPKDPKLAGAYAQQLEKLKQLPQQLDAAGKELPPGIIKELLVKDVPVAIRLEGLRSQKTEVHVLGYGASSTKTLGSHRSDVFKQSFLRPQREVEKGTGKTVLRVGLHGGYTQLGGLH